MRKRREDAGHALVTFVEDALNERMREDVRQLLQGEEQLIPRCPQMMARYHAGH